VHSTTGKNDKRTKKEALNMGKDRKYAKKMGKKCGKAKVPEMKKSDYKV
jgi:hypothetical protein